MRKIQPPALRPQHNGWTTDRQQRFVDHLVMHGSVTAAAQAAGMTRQSAYWFRRQPAGAAFAAQWDGAVDDSGRLIEDLALERLLDGEQEVIERDGVIVEVRRRPCSVHLLLYHLKRVQDRSQTGGGTRWSKSGLWQNPIDSEKLSKLRAELRELAGLTPGEEL